MPLLVSLVPASHKITANNGAVIGFLKGKGGELELTEEQFINSNDCIDLLSTRLKIEVFPNGKPKSKKVEKKEEPKKVTPIVVEKKKEEVKVSEQDIKEIVEPKKDSEIKEIIEPDKGNSINESDPKKDKPSKGKSDK